jgi:hypothetical protein
MADLGATADVDLLAQLRTERSPLIAHYGELARYVWPDYTVFDRAAEGAQAWAHRVTEPQP